MDSMAPVNPMPSPNGELQPDAGPNSPEPGFVHRRDRTKRRGIVIAVGLISLLLIVGLLALGVSFCQGMHWQQRVPLLLCAAVMLALPARMAFVCVRRKIRKGHWMIDDEERREFYSRIAGKPVNPWVVRSGWIVRAANAGLLVILFVAPLLRHQRLGVFNLFLGFVVALSFVPDLMTYQRKRRNAAA